ncbi:MAG: hypothetical protein QNJ16_09710 [Rhodobacter sp.]|nr:hypothetical protein [Rhodobacter sp.]
MTTDPTPPGVYDLPPLRASLARTTLRLAALVAIAFAVHLFVGWVMQWTEAMPPGRGVGLRTAILGGILVAYALLIAIPFVPGIEIGISLILMRGAEVAVFVYLATVAGLVLAYLAGRLLPYAWLHRVFLDLRLTRACRLLDTLRPLSPERRLALLRRQLPKRLGHFAINYRYLLLAGLINLPGSAVIGGGGGICLAAGLTHLFRPRATLITIALAVLPFPLVLWFWGPGILN